MASTQADISCAGKFYKHQPLDVKKHQIRLLKLNSPSGHTMDYSLIAFDYESAPSYVALSYTWGEKSPTGFVTIDGKNVEIRMNLFMFLSTYESDEYLYIDQICIDQSNDQERSQQVELMWKIYSRCDFVLVWLRDESAYCPSTQQAARDFNDGIHSYRRHVRCPNGSRNGKRCLDWPSLALLHNSYFERLWIVQELLLSENVWILVEGGIWVSWKALQEKHKKLQEEIREKLPSTSWLVEVQSYRFLFASHTPVSVSYYVTHTVGKYFDKKCENPRDKVYGLMALVNPSRRVEIDYAKSVQQAYLDAVMAMIREYWYMRRDTAEHGYQLHRVHWDFEVSVKASRDLAQAMGSTDLEKSGLRSFVECIWEKVSKYEVKTLLRGFEVDPETHCIKSMGFEPVTHHVSKTGRTTPTCDRWWYEFERKRYYHDCKAWSGQWKLQEYTESRKGSRSYRR